MFEFCDLNTRSGGEEVKVDEEYEWELDSVSVEPFTDEGSDTRYVAKVRLSSVEESYLNQPYNVELGVKFTQILMKVHTINGQTHLVIIK